MPGQVNTQVPRGHGGLLCCDGIYLRLSWVFALEPGYYGQRGQIERPMLFLDCLRRSSVTPTGLSRVWLSLVNYNRSKNFKCQSDSHLGAGSGGASAAYYISEFKHPCDKVNITVYERSDYVGGRSATVNVHNDASMPVELGASIFVEVNRNLVSAARKFGLTTESLSADEVLYLPKTLGVYDGQSWVFRSSESGWWTTVKILWKYGMAPIKTQRLMKATTGKFFDMYVSPAFPFKDLSRTAYDLGLTEITSSTGEQFLEKNGIVAPFSTDIIQASTRVNYAQNLDKIHALEAMVRHSSKSFFPIKYPVWSLKICYRWIV